MKAAVGAWGFPYPALLGRCLVLHSWEDPAPSAGKGSGSE